VPLENVAHLYFMTKILLATTQNNDFENTFEKINYIGPDRRNRMQYNVQG
jgi:hypothetical protein